MLSTRIADLFLQAVGFETRRFGSVIEMQNFTLQVGLPCSGFKTLIALSSFSACFVYLLQGNLLKKLFLFGSGIALSLIVNGLRISTVGVTGELVGDTASQWVHDNGGLPVTALALGSLFLLARLLRCPLTVGESDTEARPGGGSGPTGIQLPTPRRTGAVALMIAVAAVMAVRMPTIQSEARADGVATTSLPLQFGHWAGTEQPVAADVQRALPSAQIMTRRYTSPLGVADVTIVSGSDATALHDPHDCLTGEGWQFQKEELRDIETGGPRGRIRVRDVVMVRGAVRARMWYWYVVGSEIYDTTLPARLGLFRTRLTEGRRHRAEFVRLIVPGETDSSRTTTMLSDLTRQIAGR
jgi:EpsI family protein